MSHAVAVRLDSKGRLTVPREVCEELGLEPGEWFLLEREGSALRFARAGNPLDALAEQARREFEAGQTRSLRELTGGQEMGGDGG